MQIYKTLEAPQLATREQPIDRALLVSLQMVLEEFVTEVAAQRLHDWTRRFLDPDCQQEK